MMRKFLLPIGMVLLFAVTRGSDVMAAGEMDELGYCCLTAMNNNAASCSASTREVCEAFGRTVGTENPSQHFFTGNGAQAACNQSVQNNCVLPPTPLPEAWCCLGDIQDCVTVNPEAIPYTYESCEQDGGLAFAPDLLACQRACAVLSDIPTNSPAQSSSSTSGSVPVQPPSLTKFAFPFPTLPPFNPPPVNPPPLNPPPVNPPPLNPPPVNPPPTNPLVPPTPAFPPSIVGTTAGTTAGTTTVPVNVVSPFPPAAPGINGTIPVAGNPPNNGNPPNVVGPPIVNPANNPNNPNVVGPPIGNPPNNPNNPNNPNVVVPPVNGKPAAPANPNASTQPGAGNTTAGSLPGAVPPFTGKPNIPTPPGIPTGGPYAADEIVWCCEPTFMPWERKTFAECNGYPSGVVAPDKNGIPSPDDLGIACTSTIFPQCSNCEVCGDNSLWGKNRCTVDKCLTLNNGACTPTNAGWLWSTGCAPAPAACGNAACAFCEGFKKNTCVAPCRWDTGNPLWPFDNACVPSNQC